MTASAASLGLQSFEGYPPQARLLATQHVALLRSVPLPLLPILLREIASYDWKFPQERLRLERQLTWLSTLDANQRLLLFAPFTRLALPASLSSVDWVNDAADYMERLTAALWASGEMSAFRDASQAYTTQMQRAVPEPAPARARLCVVLLDSSLRNAKGGGAQFAQLRRQGTLLTGIDPGDGNSAVLAAIARRSDQAPAHAHWYIDGASPAAAGATVTVVSYAALQPVRQRLLARARDLINSQRSGPEELRSMMAHLAPEEVGLSRGDDPALARFELSLLAEGSGTQIYATTFVQWAARECLRRAEPETLVLNFQPRQRQQAMNGLLTGAQELGPDPAGSLIDAEQSAYYTWINLLRLPGAEDAHLLAWQQGSTEAVALGPGFARGTTSRVNKSMQGVLELLA